MLRLAVPAIALAGAMLFAAEPANAHHRGHDHHRYHYDHYYYVDYRSHRMPHWLRKKAHFRHWYRHTPLRFNMRIEWWQLYEIFRWERRYGMHRAYKRYHKYYDDGRRYERRHRHGHRAYRYRDYDPHRRDTRRYRDDDYREGDRRKGTRHRHDDDDD